MALEIKDIKFGVKYKITGVPESDPHRFKIGEIVIAEGFNKMMTRVSCVSVECHKIWYVEPEYLVEVEPEETIMEKLFKEARLKFPIGSVVKDKDGDIATITTMKFVDEDDSTGWSFDDYKIYYTYMDKDVDDDSLDIYIYIYDKWSTLIGSVDPAQFIDNSSSFSQLFPFS